MTKPLNFSILISFITIIFNFPISGQNLKAPASYVWVDEAGEGRQVYVYFRNSFTLEGQPGKAEINLYASSRYALWVNGHYVNFGPVRSYPQHPYYDTFDILPYLQAGNNLIAVKVMLNGMETFQLPFHTGAFIAWGEVTEANKRISLATPGSWICRRAEGYHPLAPRFSFAKGPVEVFDARLEPDDWLSETIDKTKWKTPMLLTNQNAYGQLISRSIDYLTQEVILSKFTVNRLDIQESENVFHFDALTDDRIHGNYGANPRWWDTRIFSRRSRKNLRPG